MIKPGDRVKVLDVNLKDTDLKIDYGNVYTVDRVQDLVADIQRVKLKGLNFWIMNFDLIGVVWVKRI